MKDRNKKSNVIAKLAQSMIEKETREWPPTCIGFIYQPQRPYLNSCDSNKDASDQLSEKS